MAGNEPQIHYLDRRKPINAEFSWIEDKNALFTVTQNFVNETSKEIYVINQNNFPVCISNRDVRYTPKNKFSIRTIYTFKNKHSISKTILALDTMIDNLNKYKSLAQIEKEANEGTNELVIVRKLLSDYNSRTGVVLSHSGNAFNETNGYCHIQIERVLRESELLNHRSVFDPDLNLLFIYDALDPNMLHPRSEEGITVRNAMSDHKVVNTSFSMNIDIVDNENNISKRYLYAGKEVHEIPTIKDIDRESGVYLSNVVKHGKYPEATCLKRCSLDKASEELGLYRTMEEALTGGDAKLLVEERVTALKAVTEIKKAETEVKKADNIDKSEIYAGRKYDREDVRSEVDETTKIRSLQRNDYYEERSHHRKDSIESVKFSNELIKLIPAAIATTVALYAIYNSSQQKKG